MKKALIGLGLLIAGLVGFYAGQIVFVRAIGLGFAAVGTIMLVTSSVDKDGS